MEQPELVRKVVEELESLGLPYMLVGSLASGVYGEPRFTQDIDVVVALHLSEVDSFCDAFRTARSVVNRDLSFGTRHRVTRTDVAVLAEFG